MELKHDAAKWGKKQRPITTLEEAFNIFEARGECYKCGDCYVRDFEEIKGNCCSDVIVSAAKFISSSRHAMPSFGIDFDFANDKHDSNKWGKAAKPVESFLDYARIIRADCETYRCSECPVRDYESRKGNTCSEIKNEAKVWFKRELMKSKPFSTPAPTDKPTHDKDKKKTRSALKMCKKCEHKLELEGGYLMCKKWHNITVADGYCHNFEETN